MLFPNLSTLRYSFFRGIIFFMATLFSDREDQFPGFGNHISSTLDLTVLALPADCTGGSCSSTLVTFDNFLVFYLPFSQVQTIISYSFFLKLVISIYSSIFDVVTGKLWVCH